MQCFFFIIRLAMQNKNNSPKKESSIHKVSVEMPMSYYYEKAFDESTANNEVLLFLHGYTDSASSFLRRAYPDNTLNCHVLAVNGPFPLPVKASEGYKEAYSWFFIDPYRPEKVILPPQIAIQMLTNLIAHLKLADKRFTLVGFSQGGFLAPMLAHHIQNIDKIIGLGCDYRKNAYEGLKQKHPQLKLYGIHGALDSVIECNPSHHHFEHLLKEQGFEGQFKILKNTEHIVDTEMRSSLLEILES